MSENAIGESLVDLARAARLAVPSVLWILVGGALDEALSRPADEWLVIGMFLSLVWFAPLALWAVYAGARIRARSRSAIRAAGLTIVWVLLHELVLVMGVGAESGLQFAGLLAVPALLGYGIGSILAGRRTAPEPVRGGESVVPPSADSTEAARLLDADARSRLRDEMMIRAANGFRGWTRADGSYVDGDGRGDYRRVFGAGWQTAYEMDKQAALAARGSAALGDVHVDPVEQAREWARLALEAEASGTESDV